LRQRARTNIRPPGQGSDRRGFSHHFPEPLPTLTPRGDFTLFALDTRARTFV
jgi:hypothetical protein